MPAASFQIQGGARVMIFTCDTCGAPAHFSEGCHLLAHPPVMMGVGEVPA